MDYHPPTGQTPTIARARLALRQAAQNHLFDRNVSLIDFGFPEHHGQLHTDELAIRIHVRRKMSGAELESAARKGFTRPIPASYGEFQTDVPQSPIRLHQGWYPYGGYGAPDPRTQRQDPLQGGLSISNTLQISAGTLGAVVIDRTTRALMLLSNWHVLAGTWTARPGLWITQPGSLDGGDGSDLIANLGRDAMNANLDAALAVLNTDRGLVNGEYQLGAIRGVQTAQLGMQVAKSGRTTGVTYGMVTGIEGYTSLSYDSLSRVIRNVFTIEPQNGYDQVSGPGDSGSIWLEQEGLSAVGLHFAGSDTPERALAMDIQPVLDALNVDFAGVAARPLAYAAPQEAVPAQQPAQQPVVA